MNTRRASEIRKGDLLIFKAENGRTRARVTAVEEGSEEDFHDPGELSDPKPMVRIRVTLQRAISLPHLNWRTSFWTLWHYPDDEVEMCQLQDATRW